MSKPHAAHRTITLKNFLALDAYSGQRDTEKNALKKLRDPKFDPENPTLGHTITTASYMAKICLIDGHTQRWLHEHGHIVLPDELLTTHYYVKSEKELRELYESFDAGIATKTATDQLFSLFHLENIKAKSKFFQSGTGTSAIAFAEGARRGKRGAIDVKLIDMKETIHSWRSEILKLDANIHNVSARVGKNSGILAAQMMTYRKSPVKAAKFWAAFYESKGVGDTSMPWVKLWIQSILDTKGKGGGRETTLMVLEHTLWAFDHSDDDVMLDSAPVTRLGRVHCEIYLPETIREAAKAERQAKAQAKAQATSEANISD